MKLELRLLSLLLHEDPAVSAQGRELLISQPALETMLFAAGGPAWKEMTGVRLCIGHFAPYTEAQLAALCGWGIICAEAATPLLRHLAPNSWQGGLMALRDLAAGVPPDSPVAIMKFVYQIYRSIEDGDRDEPTVDELLEAFYDLRDHLRAWMEIAMLIEEHSPTDDLSRLYEDLDTARNCSMVCWALMAAAIHRLHAPWLARWQAREYHRRVIRNAR